MFRSEVVRVNTPVALQIKRRTHGNELRQAIPLWCQSVLHPGSQRRKAAVEDMASRQKLHLRTVIVVAGPHRTDHGQIVDALPNLGEPVTHLDTRLATSLKANLRRENPRFVLVDNVVRDLLAHIF